MWFKQYKRLLLALLLTVAFAGSVEASIKIDPVLGRMKSTASLSNSSFSSLFQKNYFLTMENGSNEPAAEIILKARSEQDMPAVVNLIKSLGGSPRTVVQNFLTARIPVKAIDSLAASDKVLYIEAAKKLKRTMSVARTVTGVDKVQDGSGTGGVPYKGKDVIVGIVDSGIDCTHNDFKDANGKSRILYYYAWDNTDPNNPVRVEYSGEDLNGTSPKCKTWSDTFGHGTHVSGIAAGSDNKYTGVAPEANIIMVQFGNEDFSTAVIDGVDYILKKAKQLGKPVVINLSLGSSEGAHDNSSNFEQTLNAQLKDNNTEKQGSAIVVAAGNEAIRPGKIVSGVGLIGIHAPIDTKNNQNPSGKAYEFAISFPNSTGLLSDHPLVDIWLNSGSTCQIKTVVYSNLQVDKTNLVDAATHFKFETQFINKNGDSGPLFDKDKNIGVELDFTDGDHTENHKQHAQLFLAANPRVTAYNFDLVFKGDCTGDVWLTSENFNLGRGGFASFIDSNLGASNVRDSYFYAAGDNQKVITIPGTASNVITVGSFMSQQKWQALDGEHDQSALTGSQPNDISLFSSMGPTADGRIKPDITAPGEPIISSLSTDIGAGGIAHGNDRKGDTTHFKLEGTSMATPHIVGMVALMLQKNPTLTSSQIKDLLQNNATKDGFPNAPGPTPNNIWGAGKLNAVGTMNAIVNIVPTPTPSENPNSGSGCTLSPNVGSFSLGILMILLAVGAIVSVRFRKSE